MNLQELKNKTPADLILEAEKLGIDIDSKEIEELRMDYLTKYMIS